MTVSSKTCGLDDRLELRRWRSCSLRGSPRSFLTRRPDGRSIWTRSGSPWRSCPATTWRSTASQGPVTSASGRSPTRPSLASARRHGRPTSRSPQATIEFEVADVAAAAAELESKGHTLIHGPRTEPWGQVIARLLGPEGLLVGVLLDAVVPRRGRCHDARFVTRVRRHVDGPGVRARACLRAPRHGPLSGRVCRGPILGPPGADRRDCTARLRGGSPSNRSSG